MSVGRWLVVGAGVVTAGAVVLLVSASQRSAPPAVERPQSTAPVPYAHDLTQGPVAGGLDADPPHDGRREGMLALLRNSGPGKESWNGQANAIFDLVAESGARLRSDCFVAGCAATFSFASDDAYQTSAARLVQSSEYRGWTGGKELVADRVGEHVTVTVLLYRPD